MSRLDELIAELCPDGVASIPMGHLMTRVRERGKDSKSVTQVYVVSNTLGMVKAEDYRENTIHSEDTSNYTVVREGMIAYNPSRLNIGSIAMLKTSTPGLVSPMYVVFSIDETIVTREYFEYLMYSSYVARKIDSLKEEGARFRFEFSRWNWINVKIPPIPIQKEIVRILNTFIKQRKQLTNELSARKRQYEYYRNQCLSFEPINNENKQNIKWVTLEDIAINCDSQRKPVTKEKRSKGQYPYYGASGIVDYVDDYIFDGDYLLISEDGANLLARVTPIAFSIAGKNWVNNHAHVLKFANKYQQKYVEIFFNNEDLSKYISGAAQPKLNQKNLNSIQIPLPAEEEVKRIVETLDRFDKLCNDISIGLPAEIAARQKQYEYYRDKLLTFKELNA